jgi:transcriptional regulator with XRE-family HTH domain
VTAAHLAANLRTMRIRSGLSQSELAAKSGVGWKSISSYETAVTVPNVMVVLALIAACDWTPVKFFGLPESVKRRHLRRDRMRRLSDADLDRAALRMMENANA